MTCPFVGNVPAYGRGSASEYCFAVCMPILNRHNARLSLDKSAETTWPHLIPGLNGATV
jgi:hypothetical protein